MKNAGTAIIVCHLPQRNTVGFLVIISNWWKLFCVDAMHHYKQTCYALHMAHANLNPKNAKWIKIIGVGNGERGNEDVKGIY